MTQLVDVVHIHLLLPQQVGHLQCARHVDHCPKAYLVEELLEGPHLLGVDFKEAGQDWCEVFLDTWLAKLVGKCLKANV